MHILLLSPFHGRSSHAAWAGGLQQHSKHRFSVLSLQDRAWSWRMKGGSVPLRDAALELTDSVDAILATSLTDLSSFFGLMRHSELATKPTVYYMHENQLTYPIRPGGKRDAQLVLRQFHSQLAVDEIWFNSDYNRKSWFRQLPKFLRGFPDHQGLEHLAALEAKSKVMPVGLELPNSAPAIQNSDRPLLLWNQRWEWEKGVERFVSLLKKFPLEAPFDVVLLGGEVAASDPYRQDLREHLGNRLLHEGWSDRESYLNWLERADVTVSTARHEFFGISLLEAAAYGAMTLLPDDLSYPELLPDKIHPDCLYRSPKNLYRKLRDFLAKPEEFKATRKILQSSAYNYRWEKICPVYDEALEMLLPE